MESYTLRRRLTMAGLTIGILAALVVVIEHSRRAAAEPDIAIEEALATMGVTPGSGQAAGFELESLDGTTRTLSDYDGDVVFLNFWATWCAPCVEEMPAMQVLADEFRDERFEVVAVNVREDAEEVAGFVEMLELDYTILLDPDGQATSDFNVRGYPTTVIIGRDGTVIGTRLGYHEWDKPETLEAFAALLEQV